MSGFKERLQRMKSCQYWVTAYRKRNGGADLLHEERIEGFQLLPGKKFVTQADPFLFTHQGKTWLFYEKQNLSDMKGTLWCKNLDDPGDKPVPVLEESFHLSYPQVFRYGKYTYMIPETRKAGEVRLYKCVQFPGKWEKVDTVLEMEAVDTTVCRKSDREYYLFTYTEERLALYLCRLDRETFHVPGKEKIYESDISREHRPGGFLAEEDGKLYRPAQNCTDYYGQELIINEIDRLDEGHFKEHECRRLSPGQITLPGVNAVGIHTYNRNEKYEVIDILHKETGFHVLLKKIAWKLWGSRS